MPRPGYSAISSFSRVRILHLLQESPQRTISDLCEITGLHPNTVREHVQRLIDGGYVVPEVEKRTTRGRPRVLYSAADGVQDWSPIAARKARDAAERGDLMRRVMPWTDDHALENDAVHQLDALVEDLGDAGFDPVVDQHQLTVDLSPCPHAGSESGNRSVLCAVHLNLMDGVLAQARGPLRVEGMAQTCNPHDCVVHLTR